MEIDKIINDIFRIVLNINPYNNCGILFRSGIYHIQ